MRAGEILADELHAGAEVARRAAADFLAERWRRQMPVLSGSQIVQAEVGRGGTYGVARLSGS
jgi:hypothetical protein